MYTANEMFTWSKMIVKMLHYSIGLYIVLHTLRLYVNSVTI